MLAMYWSLKTQKGLLEVWLLSHSAFYVPSLNDKHTENITKPRSLAMKATKNSDPCFNICKPHKTAMIITSTELKI